MSKELSTDAYTLQETMLPVGHGHEIYVQDWGNPDSHTPIVFLHGGPGGGCHDSNKQYFNPKKNRVIFHDQRGAGGSTPYGSLEHNTTQDLAEDINLIAKHCKLGRFAIMGGSWGSLLGLYYALENPAKVSSLVLRGVFTGSKAEIDWTDQGQFRVMFPDVWEKFVEATPTKHRQNPTAYHFDQIINGEGEQKKRSAYAYENLEASLLSLDDRHKPDDYDEFDSVPISIEMFYLAKKCFLPERHILKNAHKLKMPTWIVQGRYDMVCPPATAYELNQKMPNSNLVMTVAGHSGSDRGNVDALKSIVSSLPPSV